MADQGLVRAAQAATTLQGPRQRTEGEGLRSPPGTLFFVIMTFHRSKTPTIMN